MRRVPDTFLALKLSKSDDVQNENARQQKNSIPHKGSLISHQTDMSQGH